MNTQTKPEVTREDWNTIRIALECLDLDTETHSGREFEAEVNALYVKLEAMGLI